MKYSHYVPSDITIKSEDKPIRFNRYIEHENKRFLQLIEGTLEEILPEDFGDITYIDRWTLDFGQSSHIKRITLPDSVIGIGDSDTSSTYNNVFPNYCAAGSITIVFPPNLEYISEYIFAEYGDGCEKICDFSKATKIPTVFEGLINSTYDDATICFQYATKIMVPASLLSSWKVSSEWSSLPSSVFVAV